MKKLIAVLCAAIVFLMAGCAAEIPAEVKFTKEYYPRVDGSTATIPLAEGLAALMLNIDRDEAKKMVSFNGTDSSYRNLMANEADLLLAYEHAKTTEDERVSNNFEWDIAPIGRDALVFIVNESNPITNITTEQARDIYSGKITNWKEVGGSDVTIEAFQRNAISGSQTMMLKLVMKDTAMMEPPKEYVVGEMDMLIDSVMSYNNSGAAIGYSVFYYAKNMHPGDGLKFLSIDGVMPSKETIQSGKYPHVNDFFAVIAKKSAKDSPQRQIFDWLQTDQGQQLVDKEGYVSIK